MSVKIDARRVLEGLGIRTTRKGKLDWASCPKRYDEDGRPDPHSDSDASWRIILDETDDRYGQHRCYGCGFGGYAPHLVRGVLGLDLPGAREWLRAYDSGEVVPSEVLIETPAHDIQGTFRLPSAVVLASQQPVERWPVAVRRYAASRGLTPAQVRRWDLGYAEQGSQRGRLVIPIRDRDGVLISYTGRSYTGSNLRYRNAKLEDGADLTAIFGEQHWGEADTVVICEGALNALACERAIETFPHRAEFPPIAIGALFGSQVVLGHIVRLSGFRRYVLASDPDRAGNKMAATLRDSFPRAEVLRLQLPEKLDCNDMAPEELAAQLHSLLERT